MTSQLESMKEDVAIALRDAEYFPVVQNTEQEQAVASLIVRYKGWMKTVEAKRTAYVKPLNNTVKLINADAKSLLAPLEEAVDRLSRSLTDYRQSDAYKETVAYREEIQEQARLAAERGDIGTLEHLADAQAELNQVAPKAVKTDGGSVSTRMVWDYEIVDESLVPREYCDVSKSKIRSAMNAGSRSIAGVRFFERMDVATRT